MCCNVRPNSTATGGRLTIKAAEIESGSGFLGCLPRDRYIRPLAAHFVTGRSALCQSMPLGARERRCRQSK